MPPTSVPAYLIAHFDDEGLPRSDGGSRHRGVQVGVRTPGSAEGCPGSEGTQQRSEDLRDQVGGHVVPRKRPVTASHESAGRRDVSAGDVTEAGHDDQQRQTERQRRGERVVSRTRDRPGKHRGDSDCRTALDEDEGTTVSATAAANMFVPTRLP